MIKRKTVFVIGAGASDEYGFPLGFGLRSDIAALMAHETSHPYEFVDQTIESAVRDALRGPTGPTMGRDRISQAAIDIIAGIEEVSSIDAFIETRQDDAIELLGKIAIAQSILRYEREGLIGKLLRLSRHSDAREAATIREHVAECWVRELGEIIFDRHTRETIDNIFDHCSFIVFNYDRSLEVLLARSIELRFGISPNKAQQIVSRARIYHPYGRVGNPFLKGDDERIRFGHNPAENLYEISRTIQTYSESRRSGTQEQIRDAISGARDIVYLGFGFLSQNIDFLSTKADSRVERIFATTYGFSGGDTGAVCDRAQSILLNQLPGFVPPNFHTEATKCRAFLQSCRMRLSER